MAAGKAVEFNNQLEEQRSNLTANQLKKARKKRAKLFQQVRKQLQAAQARSAALLLLVFCAFCAMRALVWSKAAMLNIQQLIMGMQRC
jgi:Flp pilus assembly protein TadB